MNGKGFNSLDGEPFMKLKEKDDKIYLEHVTDGILEDVCWSKDNLKKAFDKKYPAKKMYHVQADSKVEDGNESFHYNEAYSLENFSLDDMVASLMSGDLEMDIRLGVYASGNRKGKPHDNGTAFRVSPNKLDDCFAVKKKLL